MLKIYGSFGKGFSQVTHMLNMKGLSLRIKQLWPILMLFFSKVGQRSRSRSHVENLWYRPKCLVRRNTNANESSISYGKKLNRMLKFSNGQTDGQTDRVITIGHLPSGGVLNSSSHWVFGDTRVKYYYCRSKSNICIVKKRRKIQTP